jgi:uncharacterized protein (DUF58 family)
MSDSSLPALGLKRKPFAGVLQIVLALLLTAIYFGIPRIADRWSVSAHIMFRALVVIIGLVGAARLLKTMMTGNTRSRSWLRLTQHRMAIPLEGWIYLAIMFVLFTGAMLTKQNTLLLVFAFMAGPFVINGWMTFGMLQAARVQRQVPARAMQGELFAVELTVNNSRPFFALWMMSIRDEIEHAREDLSAMVLFSRVSPRISQTGQYQLRLAHRGRYRLGPLRVASRFPLGLVERSRVFSVKSQVLIYPRIGRISSSWKQRLVGATELVSRTQPHHGAYHDDFHRLREFRSGDNPRAIHWRSTARRGELVLREFQQNREHTLTIVLDLYWPASPRSDLREQIELALSFVASLLVERGRECRDGFLTLAASGEGAFRWEGQGNAYSLESLFDGLALLEPGPSREITEMLRETLQQSAAATQVLVVTTRSTNLPYQSLLTPRIDVLNLSEIGRNELVIFDDEPATSRWVSAPSETSLTQS